MNKSLENVDPFVKARALELVDAFEKNAPEEVTKIDKLNLLSMKKFERLFNDLNEAEKDEIMTMMAETPDNAVKKELKSDGKIQMLTLKHGLDPDENFDPKELSMGILVEMEHTDDPVIAKMIAKAHLFEIRDYYTRLKKMEDEAKNPISATKKNLNALEGKSQDLANKFNDLIDSKINLVKEVKTAQNYMNSDFNQADPFVNSHKEVM